MNSVYEYIHSSGISGKKQLSLLIDPDKYDSLTLSECIKTATDAGAAMVFVGGSLLVDNKVRECISVIRDHCDLPVILFPGSTMQIDDSADALLFLSLISGRNPDLLIGRHVEAAPILKRSTLEVIPTGYMLIDSGAATTVSYISNTFPIPANKPDIAACTAIAGEMLGLKLIYLDGGSGAKNCIPSTVISAVRSNVNLPIIVGGGIRTKEQARDAAQAGADIIVIGNAVESEPDLLYYFAEAINAPA